MTSTHYEEFPLEINSSKIVNEELDNLEFLSEETFDFLPSIETDENITAEIPKSEEKLYNDAFDKEEISEILEAKTVIQNQNISDEFDSEVKDKVPEKIQSTIRVPLKNLEALTDIFGELTIERNTLDLNLQNLQNLLKLLQTKVKVLEKSNFNLRNTYDRVSTPVMASVNSNNQVLTESNYFLNNYQSNFDILEMDHYNDLHLLSSEVMENIVKIQEITSDLEIHLEDAQTTSRHLTRTSKLMQNHLTQVRMRPLSDLIKYFPRNLREMSLEYDKQVDLKVRGGGTLIDRSILESLKDPLLHLFRNAFDHGIESPETRQKLGKLPTGTIEIIGSYRGNQTIITITDDGGGIDINKIKEKALTMGLSQEELDTISENELLDLIFEPGFSTAKTVTGLSGRGVGMDIVRTNLSKVRGNIQVSTEKEKGTTFVISVPFTLSIVRVLLVEIKGILLAFPSNSVEELLLLYPVKVQETIGQKVLNLDGYIIPLIELNKYLNFPNASHNFNSESVAKINQDSVLIINYNNNLVGIQVDKYWNEQEVTIRPVEGTLKMPSGFTGCTILGDGTVVPLIDTIDLLNFISNHQNNLTQKSSLYIKDGITSSYIKENPSSFNSALFDQNAQNLNAQQINNKNINNYLPQFSQKTIMIIDDSINVRRFLALTLEKAGYIVEQAKDGQDGLEKIESGIFAEAIICDIEMPRLDGYGFLANIKNNPKFQNIPVFMLTSRSGDKHRQMAINLGANGYFTKPFKEKELLKTIEESIALMNWDSVL